MAVKDVQRGHQDHDGDFVNAHRLLATELCAAFSNGRLDAGSKLALKTLFPGCRLLSVQLPVALPQKGLLSAGNMAAKERPVRAVTPLGLAAAGMALCERRWFHIAGSALPGFRKYRDLNEAFCKHGCDAVIFVPILPELPSWAAHPAHDGGPSNGAQLLTVLPALGVLTLGIESSTLVDAGLLTSLFLLAHLVAQTLLQRGSTVLLGMRELALSDSTQRSQSPFSCGSHDTPSRGVHTDGHCKKERAKSADLTLDSRKLTKDSARSLKPAATVSDSLKRSSAKGSTIQKAVETWWQAWSGP